jgi:HAD superfamily phosphoserine phosphatase-like hydrolase
LSTSKSTIAKLNSLVVFDVEGVLLPKRRYLLFEVAGMLNSRKFLKIVLVGLLYEVGLMSLQSALKRVFKVLKGLSTEELLQQFRKMPLMPGVKEVFEALNRMGYKTALISSGLPAVFVKDLAERVGADYAFGLETQVTDDHLTGEIKGDVIEAEGKALALKKLLKDKNLASYQCIIVADDRNNLPMFPLSTLKIGYNPDFLLSIKSDFVVRGDLTEILPIIEGNTKHHSQPVISKGELLREIIHISSFLVTLASKYLLGIHIVVPLIFVVTLLYIVSEFARVQGTKFPIVSAITWKAALKPELYEFATAPIFFALGIMLSLVLFPEPANYASVVILTFGDGFATIFGKRFGKTVIPFNKGKRLEGSLFGFAFAFLGALIFLNPVKALVGAALGMIIEVLPLPINDNLTIPLVTGLVLTLIP